MEDKRRQAFYIPQPILESLQEWASDNNRSLSYCMQQAVLHWLDAGAPERPIARAPRILRAPVK